MSARSIAVAAVFGVLMLQLATAVVLTEQRQDIDRLERNLDIVADADADDLARHERWLERLDVATAKHVCTAPCTVLLPPGTLEDQFGLGYGWVGKTPVVDIWKEQQ